MSSFEQHESQHREKADLVESVQVQHEHGEQSELTEVVQVAPIEQEVSLVSEIKKPRRTKKDH